MIRQWSVNLALLLLIAALVGIALFQPGLEKPENSPPLVELEHNLVKKITIQRPAHTIISFEKSGEQWRLTSPVKTRANNFLVNKLLSVMQTPSLKQIEYTDPATTAEFGLNNPRATITFNDSMLTFGDINPLNRQQYVLYDRKIHMINGNVFLLLTRQYVEYINRKLLHSSEPPIAIKFPDGNRLELAKGSWKIKGQKSSHSADDLTKLINEWRYANALRVIPYQERPILGTVQIYYKDSKSAVRLGLVSREPELILVKKNEYLQYHFPAETGRRLFLTKK